MPWWRNGIRDGLKIRFQRWIEGSSPSQGTIKVNLFRSFCLLIAPVASPYIWVRLRQSSLFGNKLPRNKFALYIHCTNEPRQDQDGFATKFVQLLGAFEAWPRRTNIGTVRPNAESDAANGRTWVANPAWLGSSVG